MNNLDQLRGRLRFGQGLGAGLGMPVALDTGTDQLADANLRPAGDLAKGPNGELLPTRVPYIEIRILAGRDGPKYAWEQVHPNPDGISTDINGGDTEAGFFAYEISGDESVPEGTIVLARYSPAGPWLLFSLGGGVDSPELVYVSSNTADAGGYPGHNYINNGDGTFTDGVSIRVQISPNGYDELQPGDQWAERNGTVGVPRTVTDGVTTKGSTTVTSATAAFTSDDKLGTISGTGIPASTTITVIGSGTSVTLSAPATADGTGISFTITPEYPLYFTPGNVQMDIADCVDDVPGTRPWSLPGPWTIGDFDPD